MVNTILLLWAKKFGHWKKIAIVFGNWLKVANYTGCQTKFIVQHLAHFWPFLKALADKLMPHSQMSFRSWLNNLASESRFSLKINAMLDWKSCFSDCSSFSKTLNKVECLTTRAFLTIIKGPRKKLRPPSQISFKVGKIMWTLDYILSLNKFYCDFKKNSKKKYVNFFSRCSYTYSDI